MHYCLILIIVIMIMIMKMMMIFIIFILVIRIIAIIDLFMTSLLPFDLFVTSLWPLYILKLIKRPQSGQFQRTSEWSKGRKGANSQRGQFPERSEWSKGCKEFDRSKRSKGHKKAFFDHSDLFRN